MTKLGRNIFGRNNFGKNINMEKGVSKTKRRCIIKLYNYREDSYLTLKYEEKAGEAFMKALVDMLQMADEYGFELISICPAA